MEGTFDEMNTQDRLRHGFNSETQFEEDMGLRDITNEHVEAIAEHVRYNTGTAIRRDAEMVIADCREAITNEAFEVHKDAKVALSKSAAELQEMIRKEKVAMIEHDRRRCCSEGDVDSYEKKRFTKKKHEFRKDLIDLYKERCCTLPLSPLVRNRDIPLNRIYVSPKLEHVDVGFTGNTFSTTKTRRATSFESIFYRNRKYVKNIYIQGEPGTGKTSFCLKIVNEWCEYDSKYHIPNTELTTCNDNATPNKFYLSDTDVVSTGKPETFDKQTHEKLEKSTPNTNQPFSDTEVIGSYNFLFFLSLRDAQGYDCDIDSMIENQIIPRLSNGDNYNRAFLQTILRCERCLILLDGLDEWSHPEHLSNTCKLPETDRYIPHRKARRYCTLFTTTRPWKLADIPIKDSEIDNLFELSGIEDTETLVENVTACLSGSSEVDKNDFMTEIRSNSLEHFLSLPLIVMQLICLWHDGKNLGASLCSIYSGVVEMLFDRRQLKVGKGNMMCLKESDVQTKPNKLNCLAGKHFCNVSEELILALGKLAFERLISENKESSLVFDNEIVAQHLLPGHLEIALDTGILSEREQRNKLRSKTSTYCFLHKTFQEFLAAVYFSTTNCPSKELEIEAYVRRENILGISDFFIFICGLDPNLATIISERIMKLLTLNINELLKASHEQKSVLFEKEMLIKQIQKMIVDGLKECQENGHDNTYLALHHTVIGRMCSDWEGCYLKQLLEMEQNKSRLETLIICRSPHQNWAIEYLQKCCNSVKNIGLYYHNQSSLSLIKFHELDYFYFEHAILECLKVRDFNPMGCVIADTNSTTVNLILTSIKAETPKLKSLSVRYVRGVISARVREIGTNLQYLHLSYVDILDCLDLSLCQNLKQVDLQWSKIKSLKINADNLEEVTVQRINAQKLIEFQSALTTGIPRLYRNNLDADMPTGELTHELCRMLPYLTHLLSIKSSQSSDIKLPFQNLDTLDNLHFRFKQCQGREGGEAGQTFENQDIELEDINVEKESTERLISILRQAKPSVNIELSNMDRCVDEIQKRIY